MMKMGFGCGYPIIRTQMKICLILLCYPWFISAKTAIMMKLSMKCGVTIQSIWKAAMRQVGGGYILFIDC